MWLFNLLNFWIMLLTDYSFLQLTFSLFCLTLIRQILCYRKIPSEEQIKYLLRKKNFKEVISLVEELEIDGDMSGDMLSFVHAQVGFLLLFDLHFKEAVDHFLFSETMQPSEIFPFVIQDPNRWSLLVNISKSVIIYFHLETYFVNGNNLLSAL